MKTPFAITIAGVMLLLLLAAENAGAADRKLCLDSANKGQQLRDHGDLIAAKKEFLICAESTCPSPLPKYCGDWLADVNSKVGGIIVKLVDSSGKDVTRTSRAMVTLDEASLASSAVGNRVDVNPGPHKVTVEIPNGGPRTVEEANVSPGEKDHVVVVVVNEKAAPMTPATTSPPKTSPSSPVEAKPKSGLAAVPIPSWIGWGVGAVGLIGFGIFGASALSDYNRYESQCGNSCTGEARDDVEQSMILADVLLGIGLVGAAVGTVFYFTRPENKSTTTAKMWRPVWSF
jgi:hypothetical protein